MKEKELENLRSTIREEIFNERLEREVKISDRREAIFEGFIIGLTLGFIIGAIVTYLLI